jgi:hypothetical protein
VLKNCYLMHHVMMPLIRSCQSIHKFSIMLTQCARSE